MRIKRGLILDENDNVVNLLEDVQKDETVEFLSGSSMKQITAKEFIPFGFKMAIKEIDRNDPIIKYGEVIGTAAQSICSGTLVHVHNLVGARGRGDLMAKNTEDPE